MKRGRKHQFFGLRVVNLSGDRTVPNTVNSLNNRKQRHKKTFFGHDGLLKTIFNFDIQASCAKNFMDQVFDPLSQPSTRHGEPDLHSRSPAMPVPGMEARRGKTRLPGLQLCRQPGPAEGAPQPGVCPA